MAVRYTVTRWSSLTAAKALEHVTASRAPRAHDTLYRMVREMVEGHGLLDREGGAKLCRAAEAAEVSPPPPGHYRRQVFKMYPDDPTSAYVEFRAERV